MTVYLEGYFYSLVSYKLGHGTYFLGMVVGVAVGTFSSERRIDKTLEHRFAVEDLLKDSDDNSKTPRRSVT